MKKLLALLVAAAFVAGCSSEKQPEAAPTLVVVKHQNASGTHKHHKKHASMSSSKMGS